MKTLLLFLVSLVLTGCGSVRTRQTDVLGPDGTQTRTTEFRARTFFDAHNDLVKTHATMTDKSQGVSIAGLGQDSSGSNAVSLANTIVEAAVRAAVKSVVPIP